MTLRAALQWSSWSGTERESSPSAASTWIRPAHLLLTNDGPLAHRLAHPRYGVDKVYEVDLEGAPSDETLRRLTDGVELEDGLTAPARVRRLRRSRIELVLHEGRNRQVRRMCEAVGHPVRRLHRPVYAGLDLRGLAEGEWRELTRDEVAGLRQLVAARVARWPIRTRRSWR